MELQGNNEAGTSAAFLKQLRDKHEGPLNMIWDNAPGAPGEAVRAYLRTPWTGAEAGEPAGLQHGLQRRRGDLRLGERGGDRESMSGKQGLDTGEDRQFPLRLVGRSGEVHRRCRTVLRSRAQGLPGGSQTNSGYTERAHPPLILV